VGTLEIPQQAASYLYFWIIGSGVSFSSIGVGTRQNQNKQGSEGTVFMLWPFAVRSFSTSVVIMLPEGNCMYSLGHSAQSVPSILSR